MLAACGVTGRSRRVLQVDRFRGSAPRPTGNSSGLRRAAGRCGRSRWAYSRSTACRRLTRACTLPEGRFGGRDTPRVDHIWVLGSECENFRRATPADERNLCVIAADACRSSHHSQRDGRRFRKSTYGKAYRLRSVTRGRTANACASRITQPGSLAVLIPSRIRRERLVDFGQRLERHLGGLPDEPWTAYAVEHDDEIAGLWHRLTALAVIACQAGRGPLEPGDDQVGQFGYTFGESPKDPTVSRS